MTITFHPLQKSDFPLLLRWLETPHVKAWWDQDIQWTPDLIRQRYENYVKGYKRLQLSDQVITKPMHAFIIHEDTQPIGYIQYYNKHDFPPEQGYDASELPTSCAAIDWYIGELSCIGRGIGPQALVLFLITYVFPHFDTVFVDPDTLNIGAIRAYEKAGFKKLPQSPNNPITFMLKEKSS